MNKNRNSAAFTAIEAIVLVCIVAFLAAILIMHLQRRPRARVQYRSMACKENLSQIGKAMAAYTQNYGDYFPFAWQRADAPPPSGDGAANAAMAMISIGCLYPMYMTTAKSFRCPSTDDAPSFIHSPGIGQLPVPPESGWSLIGCSYGYDCRISPKAVDKHAVAADMPGNHESGQNVLHVDCSVSWMKPTNFASNDPADNIYAEDAWSSDTDSYVVRMDTGLDVSFNGYPELHYGATTPPPATPPTPK